MTPFIFSSHFSNFDISLSSCQFKHYLSTVIYQTSDNIINLVNQVYNSDSKLELLMHMKKFHDSNSPTVLIENCLFKDIIGNQFNNEISSVICFYANHSGGSITILDSQFVNCRSSNLEITSNIGGALFILTTGNEHFSIILKIYYLQNVIQL